MYKLLYKFAQILFAHFKLMPWQLYPSPSKFYLLRRLNLFASRCKGMGVGVDVACADFKYRSIFQTDTYIGIDISKEGIEIGMALRAQKGDVGVVRDLMSLGEFQSCADMVVSTHTLAHLDAGVRESGVKILVDMVSENGGLFFNIPRDSDCQGLRDLLETEFGSVLRFQYGKKFFVKIEDYFSNRTGGKGIFQIIFLSLAIMVSFFFSFFERGADKIGYYVLYECLNKKKSFENESIRRLKSYGVVK